MFRFVLGFPLITTIYLLVVVEIRENGEEEAPSYHLRSSSASAVRPLTPLRGEVVTGTASWYGKGFHGRPTASGEAFDASASTAAHRTLPFGTLLRVTNLANGLSHVVRVNDRGPHKPGRILDLSHGAAQALDMDEMGLSPVEVEILPSAQDTSARDKHLGSST